MVSKGLPQAYLRKYQHTRFHIQGLGTAFPPVCSVIPLARTV